MILRSAVGLDLDCDAGSRHRVVLKADGTLQPFAHPDFSETHAEFMLALGGEIPRCLDLLIPSAGEPTLARIVHAAQQWIHVGGGFTFNALRWIHKGIGPDEATQYEGTNWEIVEKLLVHVRNRDDAGLLAQYGALNLPDVRSIPP